VLDVVVVVLDVVEVVVDDDVVVAGGVVVVIDVSTVPELAGTVWPALESDAQAINS
jgi:hypothetical protein